MLDTDTKRRIDTARDILVGKVPDPKSQVEQVTIALIYKFMDDMDAESEELGGQRKFFAGEFARYGWAKLMRSGLGGHEALNLYAEAIAKMPENPGIPLLFRDIFKNAYLPYRDPETLRAFLKIIDEFVYDHSERLGDAFEYLLSVLGSQGDAGQFRTPRHLIDFMVEVIDPQKTETILDPACGTAGFLISAYKHILRANTDAKGDSALTPDEKGRLAQNFEGYDISPDMVRLSLVNLYLHGFTDPHIDEYDTLTSEDKWNEHADVILANPPFMSPKGGIRPHKRFSVQSKRSEVLFVDYMAEHLTPSGRAGIIVPEGIIFQSQNAYKQLRQMLVDESLVAVVSLPAGVFNPYAGVKTSILILDKSLAKKVDTIAFFKIENDGFGLGAQRREIDKNDLPQARTEIAEYLRRLRVGEPVEDLQPTLGLIVAKEKIAESGEYNLSGERYRERMAVSASFPLVPLGDVCEVSKGSPITRKQVVEGTVPVIAGGQQPSCYHNEANRTGETLTVSASGAYAGFVAYFDQPIFASDCSTIQARDHLLLSKFLFRLLKSKQADIYAMQVGMGQPHVYPKDLVNFQIPLPPLEVQKEIVAEIEGYQKVIDGARAVLDNYSPQIPIHPDWPMVAVEDLVAEVPYSMKAGPFGSTLKKEFYVPSGYKIYGQEQVISGDAKFGDYYISVEKYRELESCKVKAGDVLISLVGSYGKTLIVPDDHEPGIINPRLLKLTLDSEKITPTYFVAAFAQESVMSQVQGMSHGGTMKILSLRVLRSLRVPLPPLATQQAIVAEIEAEQALVAGNRDLIARFEKKIQATLARVWGEDEPSLEGVTADSI
jgi:type I restriction enzyme M protein